MFSIVFLSPADDRYSCAVVFGKSDALKWTPVLEESCSVLESEKELPSDELLVWLVRCMRLIERSRGGFSNQDFMVMNLASSPIPALVRSWQIDMQNFWDSIPSYLQKNSALSLNPYSIIHTAHVLTF